MGEHSAPIRLTERDIHILEAIHIFDGIMSLKQIDRKFFSGKNGTWARERMRALAAYDYVRCPSDSERHLVPAGEQVYWLGRRGAKYLAGLQGEGLRSFPWRKTARWSLLLHDLAVNDFRLNVTEAVSNDPQLTLQVWVPEGEFLSNPDSVEFDNRLGKRRKRQVRPDSFFAIQRSASTSNEKPRDFAYLLELDRATEDNPRFVRDKVKPGLAYLKSRVFHQRFGYRFARWLVVTTTLQRLENMVRHASLAGGEGLFYFTTLDQTMSEDVLTKPIWHVAGRSDPVTLIPTHL